jgi:S-adenosylmethionine:tRNA ribosyltransferase-isomerase
VFEQGKEIRLARRIDAARWEALAVGGGVRQGDRLLFSPHLAADVEGVRKSMPELVLLRFSLAGGALFDQLYRMGEPVRYEYVNNPWSLSYYQTVFANHPGSVEMPSAGRAFSWELLFTLKKRGVRTAFLTLHTGLSDFDAAERMIRPEENCEFYAIPEKTARLIREAKQEGGRIIAVGTTAVRALESAAEKDGTIRSGEGWTCLRIGPGTQLQICDGLITGFHEPEASHLDLLSAFAAPPVLMEMYREALEREYLWHEFGDLHLIL